MSENSATKSISVKKNIGYSGMQYTLPVKQFLPAADDLTKFKHLILLKNGSSSGTGIT